MQTRFATTLFCFFVIGFLPSAHAQEREYNPLGYRQCDLQQAIDIALKNNPELIALESEIRAADSRMMQAAVRPNPAFSAESENFSGDKPGFSLSENTFRISQPLLLGGKLTLQKNIAEKERDIARHHYEKKRIDLISEVEHAVYDIVLFQQTVTFAQENHTNAQKLHDFIAEQKTTKNREVYQHELLSAQIELSQAAIAVYDAETQLEIAKRYLATLWGQPEQVLGKVVCELDRAFKVPEYDSLKEHVAKNNHEIKAIEEQRTREDVSLKLAKAERIPDIDVGFGVRQFAEDDSYTFVTAIAFPIPLFNRNQGRIQEAIENKRKIEAEKNILINNLSMQLGDCYRDYQNAVQQVTVYKNSILPMAQEYFDLTLREYQEGILDYLEVLNAERKLTESKKRYTEALHHLQIAVSNLEKLCAKTFHGNNGETF